MKLNNNFEKFLYAERSKSQKKENTEKNFINENKENRKNVIFFVI